MRATNFLLLGIALCGTVLIEPHTKAEEPHDQLIDGRMCADAVLNLSHHDEGRELSNLERKEGIEIIIHKATQGVSWIDKRYSKVKDQAVQQQYLWGAYHFGQYEGFLQKKEKGQVFERDPVEQARHFIKQLLTTKSTDDKSVLLVLDLEYSDEPKQLHMSLHGATTAILEIHRLTGVWPGIYTGSKFQQEHISNRILERLNDPQNATTIKETLAQCWLWLAQYDNYKTPPAIPQNAPWNNWMMWQYTTNLGELKDLHIKPDLSRRHLVAGKGGELNYIALKREAIGEWFKNHAWDYQLKDALDGRAPVAEIKQ